MHKSILHLVVILLLLPALCMAQYKLNKRPFPATKHHQLKYEYIDELHSGRMVVRDFSGKYGYVDSAFTEVIQCKYDYADPFGNGRASVVKNGKCGLIDTLGNELIPCIYNSMRQNHTAVNGNQVWTNGIDRYVIVTSNDTIRVYDLVTKTATIPIFPLINTLIIAATHIT